MRYITNNLIEKQFLIYSYLQSNLKQKYFRILFNINQSPFNTLLRSFSLFLTSDPDLLVIDDIGTMIALLIAITTFYNMKHLNPV